MSEELKTTELVQMPPSVEDREANYFAMCLLMPEKFVLADIKAMGGIDLTEDEPIRKLAHKYQVSIAMMTLRLEQLGFITGMPPV